MPTFSVVIPTHERAELVPRVVRSVLAQTFADLEVIVVDDGSGDATRSVVTRLKDSRVRYLYQTRAGSAVARNTGAAAATGDFLVFLDDDDEAMPKWLEGLLRSGADHDRCGVVSCGASYIDLQTGKERVVRPSPMGPAYDDRVALFVAGAFAVRRQLFQASGGYAARLASGVHHELALRVLPMCTQQGWSVESTDEPLVRLHIRRAEARSRNHPRVRYAAATYVLENHCQRLARCPQTLAEYRKSAGVSLFRLGERRRAIWLLFDAIRADPRRAKAYGRLALALIPPLGDWVWHSRLYRVAEGLAADPNGQEVS